MSLGGRSWVGGILYVERGIGQGSTTVTDLFLSLYELWAVLLDSALQLSIRHINVSVSLCVQDIKKKKKKKGRNG